VTGLKQVTPRQLGAPNRCGASPENPKLISDAAQRWLGAPNFKFLFFYYFSKMFFFINCHSVHITTSILLRSTL